MTDDESVLAAIHEEVALRPHDPDWAIQFEAERKRLSELFPRQFLDIEHIGSTAVWGLAAKPIIDILAGVQSLAVADELSPLLCHWGYTTSAEFNATLSDSRWFMRSSRGHRTHHLHVTVYGGDFWTQRLRFRDALRTDAELAAEYSRLKAQLAAKYRHDRETYTNAKAKFIDSATKAA